MSFLDRFGRFVTTIGDDQHLPKDPGRVMTNLVSQGHPHVLPEGFCMDPAQLTMAAQQADATLAAQTTDQSLQAAIAQNRPDLWGSLATNPSTYPDLLAWLSSTGDATVLAILQARGYSPGAIATSAASGAAAAEGVEPSEEATAVADASDSGTSTEESEPSAEDEGEDAEESQDSDDADEPSDESETGEPDNSSKDRKSVV